MRAKYQQLCLPLKLDSQAKVAALNYESNRGSNSSRPSRISKDLLLLNIVLPTPLSSCYSYCMLRPASSISLPNIMTEKAPSQGVLTEGQSPRLGHRVKS